MNGCKEKEYLKNVKILSTLHLINIIQKCPGN